MTQASPCPLANADSASAGCRNTSLTSFGLSPASARCSSTLAWAALPLATRMVLPVRSWTVAIGELVRTRICSPEPAPSHAETTRVLELAAAPKTGGVLPVIAKSMRPAFNASICGGADVEGEDSTRYGRRSRAWAARRSASVPPFWLPTCRVIPDSSVLDQLQPGIEDRLPGR